MSTQFKNPPLVVNELIKFHIDKTAAVLLSSIPIDVRFLKIESIFRSNYHREGIYHLEDYLFSPLWCSHSFLKEYIRANVAWCSPLEYLYRDQHVDLKETSKGISWCWCQEQSQNDFNIYNKYVLNFTEQEITDVLTVFDNIWTDTISLLPIENQTLMFNIDNYYIHIYTLGNIGEYRFKEHKRDIVKLPKYHKDHYDILKNRYTIDIT